MAAFWLEWTLLIAVFGMAVISPGPDFVIAVRNSVLHSRMAGLMTALGFALGVCVHIFYTIIGLATIIAQSAVLFTILKLAGAAYLIYMGIQALRSSGFTMDDSEMEKAPRKTMTTFQALRSGFLTNLLNPKATLFFLAVFSQFLKPEMSAGIHIVFGLTCILMTWLWFSCVAVVLTDPRIKAAFLKSAKWIDRICGGFLVALGVRLALAKGVAP